MRFFSIAPATWIDLRGLVMQPSVTRIVRRYLQARYKWARTLYHGTVIDHKRDIEDLGLVPSVGAFVDEMYGGEGYEPEELVFMADKEGLGSALTAMVKQISYKLGKYMHDVTDDEIKKYGLLAKMDVALDDDYYDIRHRPKDDENYYGEYPSTVEPGDYYSESGLSVDVVLTGSAMMRVLKRHGLIPRRMWGPGASKKDLMGRLMSLAVQEWQRKHRKRIDRDSRKGLLKNTKAMSEKDLKQWINYLEAKLEKKRGYRPGEIRELFTLG
jgi:hypothetical protein